jgi:hypothetical protein
VAGERLELKYLKSRKTATPAHIMGHLTHSS